jgi:predicted GNAT family N-acyltransferase
LDKLYADAPSDWLPQDQHNQGSAWALRQVNQGTPIALGLFNDRIVCAARLGAQSDSAAAAYTYQIEQVCVRSITRKRGVAKQLLVRLCQWANENQSSLYIKDDEGQLSGLYELGFVQYLQGWRFLPR